MRTVKVVPESGVLRNVSVPPTAATRSRRPIKPEPEVKSAPPQPSSETIRSNTAVVDSAEIVTSVAPEYFAALVKASATT
nr:hypothetical protein [Rhodococcus sp. BP-277]